VVLICFVQWDVDGATGQALTFDMMVVLHWTWNVLQQLTSRNADIYARPVFVFS
jgi:hypothetical protein